MQNPSLMSGHPNMTSQAPQQGGSGSGPTAEQISSAQNRLQQLKELQIRAQAELDGAEKELQNLMSSIQSEYQVNTLEELEALLASCEEKNAQDASAFVAAVAEIDKNLNELQAGV